MKRTSTRSSSRSLASALALVTLATGAQAVGARRIDSAAAPLRDRAVADGRTRVPVGGQVPSRIATVGVGRDVLRVVGGSDLDVQRTTLRRGRQAKPISLVRPGDVGAVAAATDGENVLLAWAEPADGGRQVVVQLVSTSGSPLAEPHVVVAPEDRGGSMHQPGVAVAWGGETYGLLYLVHGGAELSFVELSRSGGVLGTPIQLDTPRAAWVRLAVRDGAFLAGWLDDVARPNLRVAEIDGGRVAWMRTLTAGGDAGAFDFVVQGSDLVVVLDVARPVADGGYQFDEDLVILDLEGDGDFVRWPIADSPASEFDPHVVPQGDGYLVAHASRDGGAAAVEVKLVGPEGVTTIHREVLGSVFDVRSPVLVRDGQGTRLSWIDDRLSPYAGRRDVWEAAVTLPAAIR